MVSRRLSGTLSGAGTGAVAGLSGGPIGALIGALGGGAAGYFGSRSQRGGRGGGMSQEGGFQGGGGQQGGLFTRPGEERRFERFTPQQQQLTELLRNVLTGQGQQPSGGILGDIFGPEGFESFAAPAMRKYQEEIVPALAERFSGAFGAPGAASAQRSSGFQQMLARSGENLATRLGEARGRQQQGLLGPLLQQIMQPQYHTQFLPEEPTGLSKLLGGFGGAFAEGLGKRGAEADWSSIIGNLFNRGGTPAEGEGI